MTQPIAYNTPGPFERQIFFLSLPHPDAFPERLALPSPHIVCLLACDATHQTTDALHRLADKLIRHGVAYLCVWGPDCERVHDVFDLTVVQHQIQQEREYAIMTTWHSEERLDQALWYALEVAYPDETFVLTCHATLVVSVGNLMWDEQLQRRLTDVQQFLDEGRAANE